MCWLLVGCDRPQSLQAGPSVVLRKDVGSGPRVLCVVAHPDDETTFAATVFKTAVHDGGSVDMVVITNGEGGFKYSTLAERLYQAELTDEPVGRAKLPAIRKKEFLAGCRIMGVRAVWFLDQTDSRYSLDPQEVLDPADGAWDVPHVQARLQTILRHGQYDFVLTLLPHPMTHGHHKAATMLALEAVSQLPAAQRPVILAGSTREKGGPRVSYRQLKGHPQTEIKTDLPPWIFDRATPFGHRDRLNYQVVVNWVIAEHKSQGTMQLAMNKRPEETFYMYAMNSDGAAAKVNRWFDQLRRVPFEKRTYGASAGINR